MSITRNRDELTLAGLLHDQDGKKRQPFPVGGFYIRSGAARLNKGGIEWARAMPPYPVPYDLSTFTLLEDFVALANATTDDLLEFAKRYGPLRGLEVWGGERERLTDWQRCIASARAILTVASKLQNEQPATDEEWAALNARISSGSGAPRRMILQLQKFSLSVALNDLLLRWGVLPRMRWPESEGARFELGGNTLLSGIGAQLLCAVCGTEGYVICSACGRLYPPKKRPRAGNRFCPSCGKKAARRFAQRKYRQRQIELHRKGKAK